MACGRMAVAWHGRLGGFMAWLLPWHHMGMPLASAQPTHRWNPYHPPHVCFAPGLLQQHWCMNNCSNGSGWSSCRMNGSLACLGSG